MEKERRAMSTPTLRLRIDQHLRKKYEPLIRELEERREARGALAVVTVAAAALVAVTARGDLEQVARLLAAALTLLLLLLVNVDVVVHRHGLHRVAAGGTRASAGRLAGGGVGQVRLLGRVVAVRLARFVRLVVRLALAALLRVARTHPVSYTHLTLPTKA